jgi:Tol biopolymer transport system component
MKGGSLMKMCVRHEHSMAQWVGIAMAHFWLVSIAAGSSPQLVSATDPEFGPPAGGSGDSYLPVISRDGRYVLFGSTAENLVQLGTNRPIPALIPAPINVFLRDRTNASTVLVSVNLGGTGGGDGDSLPMGISTNGRYALFESSASNLVLGDTNNAADVFVRDLVTGTTVLVSVSANGGFADSDSYSSVMTPDGRFVAFVSAADNLVPGDTNGIPDVFVRDMVSNVTTIVSAGAQPGGSPYLSKGSEAPVMTPDGRYIAFYSTATNLAQGVGTIANVYLRDQVKATTTWASAGALPALQSLDIVTDAISFNHALSDDGRFVVFEAVAYPAVSSGVILRYDTQTAQTELIEPNAAVAVTSSFESVQDLSLTPDGRFVAYVANALDATGATTAIWIWDAQSGLSALVSGGTNGTVTEGSISDSPILDDSGRFVAFYSTAPDLVTNEIPGDFHIYLRDLQAGSTMLVDADTNGVGSLIDFNPPLAISADGRFIGFDCQDGSLVPLDRNRANDVFLRDVRAATVELISARDPNLPSMTPDGASAISSFSVSSNARFIAFWSDADDLVANDTNGQRDVFVRDTLSGTNVLVSVGTTGASGDGFSTDPAISADGRYVAFTSAADDLVSGDTNQTRDVFVRDLQAGTTTLVSVNVEGTGPGNADSFSPVLNNNGQVVLFHSLAIDLSPGMSFRNNADNLFCRDLASNRTYALTTNDFQHKVTAASMTPDGGLVALVIGNSGGFPAPTGALYIWDRSSASIIYSLAGSGSSFGPLSISPDGQKIAYVTNAANASQLMALDRVLNTNWVIASYQGPSTSSPRFSADSRFLAYVGSSSTSTNQIYLYDFQTGTNLLVSLSYDGVAPGNDQSDSPDVSSDGRFVSYRSAASNLVPGDTNGLPDVFLYDRLSGATTLVSASRFVRNSADNRSLTPVFSGDGRTLVFESWASNLIPNDFNNNVDVFSIALYGGASMTNFTVSVLPWSGSAPSKWLSWSVVPGKTYRAQFKQNLNDSTWQELGSPISIIGDRGYIQDTDSSATQRFYRIVGF